MIRAILWSLMLYGEQLPLFLILTMTVSGLFCPLAAFALSFFGKVGLWLTWACSLVLISVSCVYKLSGLARGVFDWWSVVYWSFMFFGTFGLGLAVAAIVIRKFVVEKSYSLPTAAIFGWMASIAVTPIGILVMFIVDWSIAVMHYAVRS